MCSFKSFQGKIPPPAARPISEPTGDKEKRNSNKDLDIIFKGTNWKGMPDVMLLRSQQLGDESHSAQM